MKALKIIQVLAKISEIICMVLFILCIIGAAGCLIGLIVVPIIQNTPLVDDKTLVDILAEQHVLMSEVYSGIVVGLLSCGVGAFLNKYNNIFFKEETALGTPFKMEIVKKMRKVAIVNIVATLALSIIASGSVAIIGVILHESVKFDWSLYSTIGFGISLLIISLFCEYGAEKDEPKPEDPIN